MFLPLYFIPHFWSILILYNVDIYLMNNLDWTFRGRQTRRQVCFLAPRPKWYVLEALLEVEAPSGIPIVSLKAINYAFARRKKKRDVYFSRFQIHITTKSELASPSYCTLIASQNNVYLSVTRTCLSCTTITLTNHSISLKIQNMASVKISELFIRKSVIIFLLISLSICFWCSKKRLIETVLLNTHNICFN